MKLRTLLLTFLVVGMSSLANATDAPEEADAPKFPNVAFSPCADSGHQLTVFSEGTAWNRGMKAAWLTAYNPTDNDQHVWLRIFVDGYPDAPVERYVKLGPHARHAWHINDELLTLESSSLSVATPPRKKDFNFASEVLFETVGVANLAVWELGSVGFPAYLRAAYLKGTDLCVTGQIEP